jgi:hypothetical protein
MSTQSDTIPDLLCGRETTHGSYYDNAYCTERAMSVFRKMPQWADLSPTTTLAVFMIVHKLSRAVCGQELFDDHWKDIQGYAKLVELTCEHPTTKQ